MKAQISTIEMIISVVILFIAFNIFFPGFSFKSEWKEANLMMKGRDVLLTMDRTNKLEEYSFNTTSLQNFVDKIFPKNDTILWTSIDDTVKSKLVIACNCTDEQRSQLSYWLRNLKVNNHNINSYICYTNLEEKINPCFGYYPDVLVIWGYKDLSKEEKYKKLMKDFLDKENGIVEIANLKDPIDNIQKEIFGVIACQDVTPSCGWDPPTKDVFRKPSNTTMPTYIPYKYFFHVPFPAKAPEAAGQIPVEGIAGCPATQTKKGNFTLQQNLTNFWICDSNTVYFDIDNNGTADYIARLKSSFNLIGYNFYLNYIENSSISISFRETYNFTDFLKNGSTKLFPIDKNIDRVLLSRGNYAGPSENPIPVVVMNGTIGKTAWIADFTSDGFENVRDDQKQLLHALILSVSNKKAKELTFGSVEVGRVTSYLNIMNYDMFEIYRLNLGVGYPF